MWRALRARASQVYRVGALRGTREYILESLRRMARANLLEFSKSRALCGLYETNLRAGRHVYRSDQETCGWIDCWSLYRDLCERYPDPREPLYLDCEDAASAHAAWLVGRCYRGVRIGFVPGREISHAICGVEQGGRIRIVDPCRWYGMGETRYDGALWATLDLKKE